MQEQVDVVVVGADGSWQSQRAVEAAAREARLRGWPLAVLTLARPRPSGSTLSAQTESEREAMSYAVANVARAREVAERACPDIAVETVVAVSPDAAEVQRLAGRAGLLVLGGHGSAGEAAFSLGSTSGELARRFHVPVLLPRAEAGAPTAPGASAATAAATAGAERGTGTPSSRPSEVLVALGRGSDSIALLLLSVAEAGLRGTALRVVRVVPASSSEEQLADEAHRVWAALRPLLASSDVPCRVEVVRGDPVGSLQDRCLPGDLVVVGTRGGGTLAGLIDGSVARRVLDGIACDTLVVPHEAALDVGPPAQSVAAPAHTR